MSLSDRPSLSAPLAHAARLGRGLVAAGIGLVVPPLCLSCRRPLVDPRTLCGPCVRDLEIITPPICDIMGTPLAFDAGPGARSPELRWNHPLYDKARAATVFGPMSQRLVHQLKYQDVPGMASLMARLMAPAIADLTAGADVLLPVPLHRRRLLARRYNQAVLIADALSPLVGLPVARHAVRRVRYTSHQVGLAREQRADNLHAAFRIVDRAAVDGKAVVLVDDVLTSGATADSLAVTLKAAGARAVRVAVFARVVGEGNREPA
ncbi:ComF family protein [Acuticoccus sediminis]|nr:ComF family protein [Acuticoccus sediminis]